MDIRDVRRIYDIRDVLGVSHNKKKIVCPLPMHQHHNNTPSFSIFETNGVQRFVCHGNCGRSGDVIDLVGYLHVPGYDGKDPQKVMRAVSILTSTGKVRVPDRPKPTPKLAPNAWIGLHKNLGQEVIEYAKKRGLNEETLRHHKIGQLGKIAMAIPTFEGGVLKAIKYRRIKGDGARYWSKKGSVGALFGYDEIHLATEPIIVVKGAIPKMLLWQYGILACSPTGGEAADISPYIPSFSMSKKIIVVGDNDKDPEVRRRMQEYARMRAELLNAELRFPPEQYKDIDEWILAEASAIEEIQRWMG